MKAVAISVDEVGVLLEANGSTFADVRAPGSRQAGHIPAPVHVSDHKVRAVVEAAARDRTGCLQLPRPLEGLAATTAPAARATRP